MTIDPSKLKYLRALRLRSDLTAAETHELDMADAAYGERWWMRTSDRRWLANVDELAAIRRTGRWPTRSDRIGAWFNNLRYWAHNPDSPQAVSLTSERRRYLDEIAPGWDFKAQDWDDVCDAASLFINENRRLPKLKSPDPNENRLGQWLAAQRGYAKPGSPNAHLMTEERRRKLDSKVPGWRPQRHTWNETAQLVSDFWKRSGGEWPSAKSEVEEEAQLGRWLNTQRHYAKHRNVTYAYTLTPERIQFLDGIAPGWLADREEIWRGNAERVGAFKHQHGKWPKITNPDEKALAVWLNRQRWYSKTSRPQSKQLTEARRSYLDKHAPGWSD